MAQPQFRTVNLRPRTPLGWVIGIAVLGLVITLAAVFFTAFLVLIAVGLITAPLRRLFGKKKGPSVSPPGRPRVIDAEYTVKEE